MHERIGSARRMIWYCWLWVAFCLARVWMSFSCSAPGGQPSVCGGRSCMVEVHGRRPGGLTLFVQDVGGAPIGALVGGVVECATEPRPCVAYVHVSSFLVRGIALKQHRCSTEDGLFK